MVVTSDTVRLTLAVGAEVGHELALCLAYCLFLQTFISHKYVKWQRRSASSASPLDFVHRLLIL